MLFALDGAAVEKPPTHLASQSADPFNYTPSPLCPPSLSAILFFYFTISILSARHTLLHNALVITVALPLYTL